MSKKAILILALGSVLIGFTISLTTRLSLISFTSDFAYWQIGNNIHPEPKEFDLTNDGKTVIGQSGIPFPAFSDCKIGLRGTLPNASCEKIFLGDFSIVLNATFWSLLIYAIVRPIIKKYAN